MPIFTDETIQRLFGKEDAENEEPARLKEYFFRNKAFESLTSNLPIRILVGHKGVGKSALLKIAFEEDLDKKILALWLRPDDVRAASPSPPSKDLNSLIVGWKEALNKLIAREILRSYASQADDLLNLDDPKFKVSDIVEFAKEFFAKKVGPKIDATKKSIIGNFLKNNIIRVYLDDLDRGWEGKAGDIKNISALLNSIRDLCGSKVSLQFRLGLRSDVYYLVRTSDESTDKVESNIIFLTWDNHQIMVVAAKRIESFFGRAVDENELIKKSQKQIGAYLHPIIDPVFAGLGKWENAPIHRVVLSLVRKRPRDLVKLLSGAAREAHHNDRSKITSGDLKATFEPYSNERLQDLINEFKTELPAISSLLKGMKPTRLEKKTLDAFSYSNDKLAKKIKNLMGQANFTFANGQKGDIHSLSQFLYKIDFLIGRKEQENGVILRKFFDQNRYLQDQFADFGFDWEIHPAYRWALQPTDIMDLFNDLGKDEG